MAGIEQHEASDCASSLIDQLYKAVHELEAFKDDSENKFIGQKSNHISTIQAKLKKKSEELETKEGIRDRVQELKDAAVAIIAEARANSSQRLHILLMLGKTKTPSEPARLVLNSLEGFYPPDETTQTVDKTEASLQGMRKSCVVLLEAMASFLAKFDPDNTHLLNPEIKLLAKAIADEWKPKLSNAGSGAAIDNSLEVEAFLQLLAAFKIASEFEKEQLCKLVLTIVPYDESEVNTNYDYSCIPAYRKVSSCAPPEDVLERFAEKLTRKGGGSRGADGSQDDINARELAALKAVVRCVQDYGLESDYSLIPPEKKSRPNSGFRGFRGPPGRQAPPVYSQRTAFTGMPERYLMPVQTPAVIKSRTNRPTPLKPMKDYYYTQDDKIRTSYNAATSNYGSYSGGGLQPSQQPFIFFCCLLKFTIDA
ncbi:Aspartyl protease family protein [Hibiscus syriacus]|uniref:FRIGIDA-like protein n=1 Tax=Hibiscus syriacus TaxID=106335 RepID=A0A6A2ZW69_HIBSY|nr:Aspartyl protease family protein [Hibiscus syriacus]